VSRLARDRPDFADRPLAPGLSVHIKLQAFGDVRDLLLDGLEADAAPRAFAARAVGLVTAGRVIAGEHLATRVAVDIDTIVEADVRAELVEFSSAVGPAAHLQRLRLASDLMSVSLLPSAEAAVAGDEGVPGVVFGNAKTGDKGTNVGSKNSANDKALKEGEDSTASQYDASDASKVVAAEAMGSCCVGSSISTGV
jgi:hypothetical protein